MGITNVVRPVGAPEVPNAVAQEMALLWPDLRIRWINCFGHRGEGGKIDHGECEHSPITGRTICDRFILERRVPPTVWGVDWVGPRPEYYFEEAWETPTGGYRPVDMRLIHSLRAWDLYLRYRDGGERFRDHLYQKQEQERRHRREMELQWRDAELANQRYGGSPFTTFRPNHVRPGSEIRGRALG